MMKKDMRAKVLTALKEQDPVEKCLADAWLLERFCQSTAYKNAKILATFLSFDFEYNTDLLIKKALKDGKTVVIPKTYPKGKMDFVLYEPDKLVKTKFGLMEIVDGRVVEPSAIDLIHVPGLVFNPKGYRIGFGGGYYDRYLADFDERTVSLIYPFQCQDFEEELHDVAVEEVLVYEKA